MSWKSKRQNSIALSTCEAEYMSLALCVQEAIYLIKLFNDFYSQNCVPINIGVDNQGAIQLAKNPIKHQRTKHIDVKYHFVREEIAKDNVHLFYVPSSENIADLLTKPLSKSRLNHLINLENCNN